MNFRANSQERYDVLGSTIYTSFFSYDPKKPLALIMPGHRADTARIVPFIKLLESKYNIISFDLPGFGKSVPYKRDYKEYISYCRSVLKEMIQILELREEDINIFGISLSSNVIIDYLLHYPDSKFKKIGLMAPIYSYKNLTMKPSYKKFVRWFTTKLEEDKRFTRTLQRMFDNKKVFTACMIMFDIECWKSKAIRDYEYDQWHLQTMQHWGETLKDFLEIDLSNVKAHENYKNISFAYPKSDQYLDVNASIEGFKKIFPNAQFKFFESSKHIPRGNFTEDEEFMESINKIISLVA